MALTLAVRDLTNNSEIELDLKKYNFHYAHISLVDKNCTLIEISDYEKCQSLTIESTGSALVLRNEIVDKKVIYTTLAPQTRNLEHTDKKLNIEQKVW